MSAKIYRPGEIVGPLTRNDYSDPARGSAQSLRAQTALDAGRPRGAVSRLSAHFAFDTPELCLAYWSAEAKRAKACGDAASPYLLPPRYYEIEMAAPVKAPMAVAEWVFQLVAHHVDPAPAITEYWAPRPAWRVWEYLDREMTVVGETGLPTDPRGLALLLHGEDRKTVKANWPLPG
ncbi:MAG: hypothetical protein ACRD1X_07970 [Vicinamibacteria bacterium]